jgi:hypothetical protein
MSMQTARRRPEKRTADGLERISGASSLIDVLERVLDKGIVIDPWLRASSVSIDLLAYQSRQRRRTRKTKPRR